LFPGLVIMAFGLGGVFVGVQTAANAGVPPSLAGLAGALINASTQVGAALGLAIFSALATSRTNSLLAAHAAPDAAATSGFHLALVAGSIFLVATAFIALRATNTRGEPTTEISGALADDVTRDAAGSQRGALRRQHVVAERGVIGAEPPDVGDPVVGHLRDPVRVASASVAARPKDSPGCAMPDGLSATKSGLLSASPP
jgi:MFS family permease